MTSYSAAVIAAGSQGRVHAHGYSCLPGVDVVAVADVDAASAQRLAVEFDVPRRYADYEELLVVERPALLSICTPPALHREIVTAAIAAGVRAIHCEKPMALTYGDALAMHESARKHGVLLTINHQRRFESLHRAVRSAVDTGEIGDVTGIDGYCANLFDWGSHVLDLIFFYLGDRPAESVLGQIDVTTRRHIYGAVVESASVSHVHWPDGVNAVVFTGRDHDRPGPQGSTGIVVHGATGRIDVFGKTATVHRDDAPTRVIESQVDDRHRVDLGGVDPAIIQATADALADLVGAVESGTTPVLDSTHALAAAELIFATYESSARRAKVTLPLDITDNPLHRGLAKGYWKTEGETFATF